MPAIGLQSYVYHQFTADELIEEIADLPIEAIEINCHHIDVGADPGEIESFRAKFEDAGIDICGFGVHDFDTVEGVEPALDLVDGLGADYVSAHFDPEDDALIEAIVEGAGDRDLLVGAHPHGPGDLGFGTVEEILDAVEGYDERLGACVDTAQLFRVGQDPDHVVPALGDRLHAVHLRDKDDDGNGTVPGEGRLDLEQFIDLLDRHTEFHQPIAIEFAADSSNPTPSVTAACDQLLPFR